MLGFAHAIGGHVDLGLPHARYAVELAPGDPLARQILAGILLLGGDANAAIEPVYEAMRLDT